MSAKKNLLEALRLLDECEKGNHKLEALLTAGGSFDMFSQTARWCQVCGAVVVDQEVDGRLHSVVIPMKGSSVTRFLEKKIRQGLEEFRAELRRAKSQKKHVDEKNIIRTITHNKRLQAMTQALNLSEEEILEINKEIQ